ncbi:NADPH-Fe(3+) oxidoreductase subunit beta [termite gut metagenome]|uniref:NADPH-Fe(3+) oxidoreductase subunit beta n=1 Tax=termite gut metagenome TaxID=433724 RepID=A0A5J4SQ14_9ZZZZ
MKIQINNKEIETLPGETLLEAARREGYSIPSLCYAKEAKHKSSCMVCAMRNAATGQIFPSCTTFPVEGMQIDTESPEIIRTRTLSLELLLSDHRADCEAPCHTACPGNMDVAAMNRLYDQGKTSEALALLRDTLVIPATLCYICNAPCEKICRKGDVNTHVPVREIKKALVATTELDKITSTAPGNGRTVAIAGTDPMALAAAYHLRKLGYAVTLFEKADAILSPYIQAGQVPADILQLEIEVIRRLGIEIIHTQVEPSLNDYDSVIATVYEAPDPRWMTPRTKTKQPARLVLEGHRLAERTHASLSAGAEASEQDNKTFNSTYTRFTEAEKRRFKQSPPSVDHASGCLYCDCDAKTSCRLRQFATEYSIRSSRYTKNATYEALHRQEAGRNIWFEQAKCIKCGLCVYNSNNGFTFKDRGFIMQVVLPEENKENIDEQLPELCPTGALYYR